MGNVLHHPDADSLMRYADGEIPSRHARKIKSHLESCWQCRTELKEMQDVVGECMRYRQDVLKTMLPEPPAPWRDITLQFDRIDASLERRSWFAAAFANLRRPAMTWIPAAAAVAVAVIAYNHLHNAPSVEASALLRKAVLAGEAAPTPRPHQIRIRTKDRTVVRPAALHFTPVGPLEPLSVRSYQKWHDELPARRDSVETLDGKYAIRTSTDSGDLAEATLQLRTADLHPVQERIEFRNHDWVEIEEVPESPALPSSGLVATNSVHPSEPIPAPVAPPAPDQFRQPAPAATVGDELSVLVALHNAGADLGDPVDVKREDGRILVAGVGVDPARRLEIERAVGERPNVIFQFSDADGSSSQPETRVRGDAAPTTDIVALQGRIEKQVGGRVNYENLSSQTLDASESMMARAYALRRLAERFPASQDAEMTDSDRQVLHDLYRAHANALAQQALEIDRLLKPVLSPIGGKTAKPHTAPAESWQAGTENMFTIARHVESLLAVMLGVAPGETNGKDIPSQVLSNLAQLRASAEAYGPAGSSESKP